MKRTTRNLIVWLILLLAAAVLVATLSEPVSRLWKIGSNIVQIVSETKKTISHNRSLPNPVQSVDGMSYIPIEDTAFLIPDKTWLKSYARNSTDGTVNSITLHATVPDVQPWSQERHDEMYGVGMGKKLEIYVKGKIVLDQEFFVSRSNRQGRFIEEPSDQAAQGLRQFRRLRFSYDDEEKAKKDAEQFGDDYVQYRRDQAGKPYMNTVFYELIENDLVKYFIYCNDRIKWDCHLIMPWSSAIGVDVYFMRKDINHIVAMADKLTERLHEFEAAGLDYRAALPTMNSPSTINQ